MASILPLLEMLKSNDTLRRLNTDPHLVSIILIKDISSMKSRPHLDAQDGVGLGDRLVLGGFVLVGHTAPRKLAAAFSMQAMISSLDWAR